MDVFNTIVMAVWTVITWVWLILNTLFAIPFFGWFIQLGFYAAVGWLIYKTYRAMPSRVREFTHKRIAPSANWMTRWPRWYLVHWLAEPEWLRQSGGPALKVVEKKVEVQVPKRRSIGAWLTSGIRWGVFYTLAYIAFVNWSSIISLFNR